MIRIWIITALLSMSQVSLPEPEYVTIRTQRFSYLPYEFSLQIPGDYREIEWYLMSGQPMEIHVTFPNGGYVYLSQQKYIPNTGRIKSLGDDVYHQRFSFLLDRPDAIYNPNGEELVLLKNEGKDSEGLYWRDVHYIFPDSICYIQRRVGIVRVNKDRRFRLSLGYSNVSNEDKEVFDKIIESMMISPVEKAKDTSYDSTWIYVDAENPRIRRICVMPSVEEIQKQ